MAQNNNENLSYEDKLKNATQVVADDGSICLDFELEEVNARIKEAKEKAKKELELRKKQQEKLQK